MWNVDAVVGMGDMSVDMVNRVRVVKVGLRGEDEDGMSPREFKRRGGRMKNKTKAASQRSEDVRWSGGGRRS
jgi:hypothetical protein